MNEISSRLVADAAQTIMGLLSDARTAHQKRYAAVLYSFDRLAGFESARVIAKDHNTELLHQNSLEHAEINVLNSAAKDLWAHKQIPLADRTRDFILFVNTRSCPKCTAAIADAGIFEVRFFFDNNYDANGAYTSLILETSSRLKNLGRPYVFRELDSEFKEAIREQTLRSDEPTSSDPSTRQSLDTYLRYLRREGGRYWDLAALLRPGGPTICGAVLHDDAEALRQSLTALRSQSAIEICTADSGRRFRNWFVDFRDGSAWRRIVLVETGMGSMNASNAIYELAAVLRGPQACRIIKVGTCLGLYTDIRAGTVLVPSCAIDDEGATTWNCQEEEWPFEFQRRLRNRRPINAHPNLTADWLGYLSNSGRLDVAPIGSFENKRPAVWTCENFHGARHRAKEVFRLFEENRVSLAPEEDNVPVCIENECSSHFSACEYLNMPIATALVVSWSCDQVSSLAISGDNIRPPKEKDTVHQTEERLLASAVNYLFDSALEATSS